MILGKFIKQSLLFNVRLVHNHKNITFSNSIFLKNSQKFKNLFMLKKSLSSQSNKWNSQRRRVLPKADISMKNVFWYSLSGFVLMVGVSYAAVPLYKQFCESTGYDANTNFRDMEFDNLKNKLISMKKVENRSIKVKFVASTSANILWDFEPSQSEISVAPGETALAFFKAKNKSDRSVIGIGKMNFFINK